MGLVFRLCRQVRGRFLCQLLVMSLLVLPDKIYGFRPRFAVVSRSCPVQTGPLGRLEVGGGDLGGPGLGSVFNSDLEHMAQTSKSAKQLVEGDGRRRRLLMVFTLDSFSEKWSSTSRARLRDRSTARLSEELKGRPPTQRGMADALWAKRVWDMDVTSFCQLF